MSELSSNAIHLSVWQEIVGPYLGIQETSFFTYFRIGKKNLEFCAESKEAEILRTELKPEVIDQTVGILRTDNNEQPFVIRLMKKSNQASIEIENLTKKELTN